MTKEIEKLCADILPETWKKYLESKGWEEYKTHRGEFNLDYPKNPKEYRMSMFVSYKAFEYIDVLSFREDRPILAILFDLWKIQNPEKSASEWADIVLELFGLKELRRLLKFTNDANFHWHSICGKRKSQIDEKDKQIAELEDEAGRRKGEVRILRGQIDSYAENRRELEAENERLKKEVETGGEGKCRTRDRFCENHCALDDCPFESEAEKQSIATASLENGKELENAE